ncbi:MAG: Trm112 family protein [Proteobacteria bacterium]|jgi:uncharacterized protein|nr:Trm112 family protein [Pseudomonadota bacterium]
MKPPNKDLDPKLRQLLVCPLCRGELEDHEQGLRCGTDKLIFPIRDGVPYMVRELAIREKGC